MDKIVFSLHLRCRDLSYANYVRFSQALPIHVWLGQELFKTLWDTFVVKEKEHMASDRGRFVTCEK